MAKDDSASVIPLHQPRPKTSAERGRAFRERQRMAKALRAKEAKRANPQPIEKPATFETFPNGDLTFAALEASTARRSYRRWANRSCRPPSAGPRGR